MPEEPDVDAEREMADVVRWRRRQALAAGMSTVEAKLFAESEISVEDLRRLVKLGCPKPLLARIVL